LLLFPQRKKILEVKKADLCLTDCLMSALAVFGLKFPSLLGFDQRKNEEIIKHNLQTLYQIEKVPSDTTMERLWMKSIQSLFEDLRREHPHLKAIIVEDALSSNGPHIKELQISHLKILTMSKKHFQKVKNKITKQLFRR
jgi:hypothetical protein